MPEPRIITVQIAEEPRIESGQIGRRGLLHGSRQRHEVDTLHVCHVGRTFHRLGRGRIGLHLGTPHLGGRASRAAQTRRRDCHAAVVRHAVGDDARGRYKAVTRSRGTAQKRRLNVAAHHTQTRRMAQLRHAGHIFGTPLQRPVRALSNLAARRRRQIPRNDETQRRPFGCGHLLQYLPDVGIEMALRCRGAALGRAAGGIAPRTRTRRVVPCRAESGAGRDTDLDILLRSRGQRCAQSLPPPFAHGVVAYGPAEARQRQLADNDTFEALACEGAYILLDTFGRDISRNPAPEERHVVAAAVGRAARHPRRLYARGAILEEVTHGEGFAHSVAAAASGRKRHDTYRKHGPVQKTFHNIPYHEAIHSSMTAMRRMITSFIRATACSYE